MTRIYAKQHAESNILLKLYIVLICVDYMDIPNIQRKRLYCIFCSLSRSTNLAHYISHNAEIYSIQN